MSGALDDSASIDALVRSRIPHAAEYYDLLKYEWDPCSGYRLCRNQRLPHVTVNAQGFRGSSFTGGEKVLVVGDSVTFGVGGSSDERCFARFLAEALGMPVADASVRAYRTFQHFMQMPRLFNLLPDVRLVILWIGFADLLYWTTSGGRVEGTFRFERKYGWRAVRTSLLQRAAAALLERLAPEDTTPRSGETGTIDQLAQHVAIYVEAIGHLCAARHAELKVLVQPFVRARPVDPELRRISDFWSAKTETKCGMPWYELADRYVASLLRQLSAVSGSHIVDMQPHFSESDFLDQVHLREDAVRSAAFLVGRSA